MVFVCFFACLFAFPLQRKLSPLIQIDMCPKDIVLRLVAAFLARQIVAPQELCSSRKTVFVVFVVFVAFLVLFCFAFVVVFAV